MDEQIIKVKLPLNLQEKDFELFIPYQQYKLDKLIVKKIRKAFVSAIGFCLDESGLVKECHHRYPEQLKDYESQANFYYEQTLLDDSTLVRLDDEEEYLVIHHPWLNYYHWLTEIIPKLWMIKDRLRDLILILPEKYLAINFVTESLEPFEFKDVFVLPFNKNLYVENLCLPQIKPICATYDVNMVNEFRDLYTRHIVESSKSTLFLGKRIYISRKLSRTRKIINESAVEEVLKKYDFVIVCSEQYSFFEQVSIFAKADVLVSIHGAGLTNMLFMPAKSKIIELHKRITAARDHHSHVYWYLASALDHDYYHQICEPTDPAADFFTADFIVNINDFEQTLVMATAD